MCIYVPVSDVRNPWLRYNLQLSLKFSWKIYSKVKLKSAASSCCECVWHLGGKCGKSAGFRGSRDLRHHRKGESRRANAHEVWGCELTRIALNWRVSWERAFPLHLRYMKWEFPPLCPAPQCTNLGAIGNVGQPSHSLFLNAGQGTAKEESHWLMEKAGKCSCAFATHWFGKTLLKLGWTTRFS